MADCLTFSAGQVATLTAQFVTSPTGQPIDAVGPKVAVYDGPQAVLEPTDMAHVMTGFYYYDWIIPHQLPAKTYTVRYTGQVNGVDTAATDYVRIFPAGTPTGMTQTPTQIELIAALDSYLGCCQNIPVYNELGRRSPTRDLFQFSWPRWNLGNHAVFVNDFQETDGYSIDVDGGIIRFQSPLLDSDRVVASYNFRFFSQIDLLRFIVDALNFFNIEVPGSNWTLERLPDMFVGIVLQGAAAQAIKKMLMCLNFQQTQTIFGGPEAAKSAQSELRALKENYEKQFMEYKKQAKRMRYPQLAAVVQPEYTLPGGRSRWFRYLFSSSIY